VKTFADDEIGARRVEVGVGRRAGRALHAMIRPHGLLPVGRGDSVERRRTGIRGSEGEMVLRMPVLRHHHMRKRRYQTVGGGHNRIAVCYGERSAGTEIVLDIDDEKKVAVTHRFPALPFPGPRSQSRGSLRSALLFQCGPVTKLSEYAGLMRRFPTNRAAPRSGSF